MSFSRLLHMSETQSKTTPTTHPRIGTIMPPIGSKMSAPTSHRARFLRLDTEPLPRLGGDVRRIPEPIEEGAHLGLALGLEA